MDDVLSGMGAAEISVLGFSDIRFLITYNSVSLNSVYVDLLRQFSLCLSLPFFLSPFHLLLST